MKLNIRIYMADTDDPLEEYIESDLIEITIEGTSTIEDVKKRIEEEQDFDPSTQQIFHMFHQLNNDDVIKDILKEGDTLTAAIAETSGNESAIAVHNADDQEVLSVIVGTKRSWKCIPIFPNKNKEARTIKHGFFNSSMNFAVVFKKEEGTEAIYHAFCYKVEHGAAIEIAAPKEVFKNVDGKRTRLEPDEEKVFRESGQAIEQFISFMGATFRDVISKSARGAVRGAVHGVMENYYASPSDCP